MRTSIIFEDGIHREVNQKNYSENAEGHDRLSLNSTLFLAYRDIPSLLERHLYPKLESKNIRMLDFGCGVALSTQIISTLLQKSHYSVEILGVDISEENLKVARKKIPHGQFLKIEPSLR